MLSLPRSLPTRYVLFLGLAVIAVLALACAKSEDAAAPTPAKPAAPAAPAAVPAPAPAPAPAAAPAPAPAVPTPAPTAAVAPAPSASQPLVPGGPPYYRAEFESSTAGQALLKYHFNKWTLWTKAKYGGELRTAGAWSPSVHLDFLKTQTLGRPSLAGMLILVDMGVCSMVGRDQDFSTCKGQYAHNTSVVLIPGILQRWEQPDPLTYIFTVRRGVLWPAVPPMARTDREVTAEDIAWFLDVTKREGTLKDNFALVKAFEAPDRYTVKVSMQSPHAELLPNMAHLSMAIFPKECYEEKGCLGSKQVSPAPFLITEAIVRQKLVMAKNPEFWLRGLPYLDRMVQINISDPNAQDAAVATGQLDLTGGQNLASSERLWKKTPGSLIQTEGILAGVQAFEPRYVGPFADVRVRRALAMAMDIKTIHQAAEGFNWFPTLASRHLFGADFQLSIDNQASQWYKFNPQAAKQLLTEAGYANGFDTTLTTWTCSGANYDMMLVIQANWKKHLNVDMAIKCTDIVAGRTVLYDGKWPGIMYLRPHNLGYWAGADVALLRFTAGSAVNLQKMNDPKMDDFYLRQRAELDPAKRVKILWDFEQYEMDQVYVLRFAWTWGIMVKNGWELNCAGHEMTYCGVTNSPGWLSMMDTSLQPKR